MKRVGIMLICGLLLVSPALLAQQDSDAQDQQQSQSDNQQSGDRAPQTIEELYLSQDVEVQIIRSQALSTDRSTKLLALQSIRSMVENGTLSSADSELFPVLETLATSGTRREVRSGGSVINNFPEIRRQAVGLLGDVGGDEAKRVLADVLKVEDEPMVQAEAVYALGRLEDERDSRTLDRIARVLSRENAERAPDNNLAFASMLAIEKISERVGGISDPEVINALLGVTSASYIRDVRLKAIDVIYQLRGGGQS
jgi:HEAT repeat protein